MVADRSVQEQLNLIKKENDTLKRRLSIIERELNLQTAPPEKKSAKKEKKETFETAVGMTWFGRIGMLALVIGIGFFIKYAFDNNWISLKLRIFLGIISGVILVIAGFIFSKREKYEKWGQTVCGGGFAITYFSIYASYHFDEYRLATGMSAILSIVLLGLVATVAALLSIKTNSKIMAGEAFFLGFVASFLSREFEVLTLAYGLILTFGIVFIVSYKKWAELGIGAVIATYVFYSIWSFTVKSSFPISTIFLLAYFFAYNILSYNVAAINQKNAQSQSMFIIIINSVLFFILYAFLLGRFHENSLYLLAFSLSAFYSLMVYIAKRAQSRNLEKASFYLALTYFTLAIMLKANSEWVTVFLAAEAVLLTILASQIESDSLKKAAYAVSILVASKTLFFDSWALNQFSFQEILESTRMLAYLATIIAFYIIAWHALNKNTKRSEEESRDFDIYSASATILLLFLVLFEMKRFWISIGWSVIALCSLLSGFYLKRKNLRLQGIIIFMIVVFKVFLLDTIELGTLYRTASFITLGVILLIASFAYAKYKDKIKEIL